MFSRLLIRKKILYSTLLLTVSLLMLMYCSLRGVYAYRDLTKSIRTLSHEFERIWTLRQQVADLRSSLHGLDTLRGETRVAPSIREVRTRFLAHMYFVRQEFEFHEKQIQEHTSASDPLLAITDSELATIRSIKQAFQQIDADAFDREVDRTARIDDQLESVESDLLLLFNFLTDRMYSFRSEMRARYHTWIAVIVVSALASLVNVGFSFWFFRHSVVQPFKVLLSGSRAIASGEFDHRIRLKSHDELAELAEAMNSMTGRFVQIRNNLNEQVQQRTREVVRSEQLASVGFLAAGVAHEINNPLASIAWSAEALESRLHEVLHPPQQTDADEPAREYDEEQVDVLRKYLKRIQDEAFRCKGITERLLDFSRLGESQQKQQTDIHEAVSDVIALVRHLGQYRNRKLSFRGTPGILAWVSQTEFKQVVLNLLTNSLDASEDGDVVHVVLEAEPDVFILRVTDQGCGMTPEVMTHLFEPFFTRRRDGRGTGLGLSISYRIVQDHGGELIPSSPGPNQGSSFELRMPLMPVEAEDYERLQAA